MKSPAPPGVSHTEEVSYQEIPKPAGPPPRRQPEVRVFDAAAGKELVRLKSKELPENVQRLQFDPDGKHLAAVGGPWGGQRFVVVWNVSTGKEVLARNDFAGELAFSPIGGLLALVVGGQSAEPPLAMAAMPKREGMREPARAAPAAKPAAEVKVYDLATAQVVLTLAGHKDRIARVAFSADGKCIATTGGVQPVPGVPPGAGEVLVREVRSRRLLATFLGHTGLVAAVAFSPDGALLATGGFDGSVKVWQLSVTIPIEKATWRMGIPPTIRDLGGRTLRHGETVDAVAFRPDGAVATANGDGTISVVRLTQ